MLPPPPPLLLLLLILLLILLLHLLLLKAAQQLAVQKNKLKLTSPSAKHYRQSVVKFHTAPRDHTRMRRTELEPPPQFEL
jgi:hypothetical protein